MKRIIFVATILFICLSVFSQDSGMVTRLEKLMPQYDSLNQFSGTIAMAYHGKVIYEKSFGFADFKNNILNNSSTEFNPHCRLLVKN